MSKRSKSTSFRLGGAILALALWPFTATAQVAVAEIQPVDSLSTVSASELETLVGPIALYPDDLLAIVLPATSFPLQIVEAQRFLQALENDPTLEPDDDWDDSIVALLNYPEVVDLLNEDLDWSWRLGEAVVAQQADVIAAIELFRDRAYDAGNLKSDDYQVVAVEGSSIQITPVQEDIIYVPYYEPERVVVYQPRPVYYYYPRAYPVYYYPYPQYHSFHSGFFWGVTTAFSIGWHSHHLNVFHHSYYGHPYYGYSYWDRGWYRRPDLHVYNNIYVRNSVNVSTNRYRDGDHWEPNNRRTVRASDQRITRSRGYPNPNSPASSNTSSGPARVATSNRTGQSTRSTGTRNAPGSEDRPDFRFRDRGIETGPASTRSSSNTATGPARIATDNRTGQSTRSTGSRNATNSEDRPDFRFRDRGLETGPASTRPSSTTRPSSQPRVSGSTPSQRSSQPGTSQSRQPQLTRPQSSSPQIARTETSRPQVNRAPASRPQVSRAPTSRPQVNTAPSRSVPQTRQSAPRISTQRQSRPQQSQSSRAPSAGASRSSDSSSRSSSRSSTGSRRDR